MIKTVLIAPDSFKGSLSAHEAATAIERGVRRILADARIIKHPVSDGGEGLVSVVTPVLGGRIVTSRVSGPLAGQLVDAQWGLSGDGKLAVIEMAEAAGLPLVPANRRDPKITTTYGVGELIRIALDAGVSSLLIGIGGSATNDAGAGMAEALGVRFSDARGNPVPRGGAALAEVAHIDVEARDPRIDRVDVNVACDVQNTLCGQDGASEVYGPQKGASPSDVVLLDRALAKFGKIIHSSMGIDVMGLAGGGAAGGLGAGLVAFCGGKLNGGIDLVLEATGFEKALAGVDLIITGEGKIDAQVQFGKALAGVVGSAHRHRVPVIAVVGALDGKRADFVNENFLTDLEPLVDSKTTMPEAIRNASQLVEDKTGLLLQRYLNRTYQC